MGDVENSEMTPKEFGLFLESIQNEKLSIEEIKKMIFDLKVKGDIYGLFFGETPEKYSLMNRSDHEEEESIDQISKKFEKKKNTMKSEEIHINTSEEEKNVCNRSLGSRLSSK